MVLVLLSLRVMVPILAVALAGAVGGRARSSCADCKAVGESLVALREDLKTRHTVDLWYLWLKRFRRLPDHVASYLGGQLARSHCPEDAAKRIKEFLHQGTAAISYVNLEKMLHSELHLGSAPEWDVGTFIEDVRQHYAITRRLTTTTRVLPASPSSKDAAAAEPIGKERDNDITDTISGALSVCSSPPCLHDSIGMMVDSPPNYVEAEPVDPVKIAEIRQLGDAVAVPVTGIMSAPADPGSLPEVSVGSESNTKQPCTDPLSGHSQGSLHNVPNGSGVAPDSISATPTTIDALQAAVMPPSSDERESALSASNERAAPTEPTPFKRHLTLINVNPVAVVPPSASPSNSIMTDPSRPGLVLCAQGALDKSSGLTHAHIAAGAILLSVTALLARFRDRRHHDSHPGRGVAAPPKPPSISSRHAVGGAAAALSAMALISRAMSHRRAVPQSLSDASDSAPRPSPGTWIRSVTYTAILSLLAVGTFLIIAGYRYQRRRRPLVTIHADPDELVYKPFSLTSGIPL
ncbi:unnamed protein product (mitochondrion) [Plasmodiophora brassicae]|uniref:Uncharacterized protein n=1 Tax=Plasmodiophora brassicae TaxID=37360 RepID=A0A3P3Y5M0_PLABS|nr:unnamed protein product [Plasmodiophora brassicae]